MSDAPTLYPSLRYRDAKAAIEFLKAAFDFREVVVYENPDDGAIAQEARAIVERDGIEALTMRATAAALGASPMSLYRHVRDKDELLVLLLDQLASELPRPRLPREPRARLRAACRAMRDGLHEH